MDSATSSTSRLSQPDAASSRRLGSSASSHVASLYRMSRTNGFKVGSATTNTCSNSTSEPHVPSTTAQPTPYSPGRFTSTTSDTSPTTQPCTATSLSRYPASTPTAPEGSRTDKSLLSNLPIAATRTICFLPMCPRPATSTTSYSESTPSSSFGCSRALSSPQGGYSTVSKGATSTL